MKKPLFLVVAAAVLAACVILNQGCSSLGDLPDGKVWYKPGADENQTKYDWLICQQAALLNTSPQAVANRYQSTPSPPLNSYSTVNPNAYGLGVNADQYGRPTTYQLQNGQQLDPIFNEGVKQNVFGPGIGQDQFGRPVYNSPYGYGVGQQNNVSQGSGVGDQIALNMLSAMEQNNTAKKYMTAKGYRLVSTNSPSQKAKH